MAVELYVRLELCNLAAGAPAPKVAMFEQQAEQSEAFSDSDFPGGTVLIEAPEIPEMFV